MVKHFVIDNSVVMSWCFKDETNKYAEGILHRLSEATAFAPSIWPLEIVNVLLVAERKKRLSEADSARFMTLLTQLPIVLEADHTESSMKELLIFARANNLSSYDASYLDLAMKSGYPIATLDTKLIRAARKIDVQILPG